MADLATSPWLGLTPEELTPEQLQEMALAEQAPLPPEAIAAMGPSPKGAQNPLDRFRQMQSEALASDKAGIDVYEKSINGLLNKGPSGIDFTPLAALADSWSKGGGNSLTQAAMASKPMSEEKRQELATKLQDELQKRRGDYTKAQLESAKTDLMYGLGLAKAAKGQKLPISEVEKIADATASQQALEDVKKLVQANEALFGPGQGLLSKGKAWSGVGAEGRKASVIDASLGQLAQIIGKGLEGGKLTDQDIVRYRGMLPQFGDDPNVVQDKVTSLQRLIEQKQLSSLSTAQAAGYSTEGIARPKGNYKKPGVNFQAGTGGNAPAANEDPAMARLIELRKKFGKE